MPDHLVTAGSGHIRFWKMAQTFTGLKLQGQLGRFGKTDVSDVVGIFSMPDEKVISSCDWGNLLVWDEQLVTLEVMRKGRKPCHLAPIIMLFYSKHTAELTTVSMDGTIKFWYYPTIETADPPEDDRILEMEPSFTINVQDSIGVAKITGICKLDCSDPSSYDYFIQDGNGGLWLADIEVTANAKPLKRLAKFHGDQITSLQPSPIGYFISTTSLDGWLHVHDVVNKKLIFMHDFAVPVTSSIWLPLEIVKSGNIFAIGFQTGILKMVAVSFSPVISPSSSFADIIGDENARLVVLQSSKPHTSSIRHLTVNRRANVLVCGSDDRSIFVYKIETEPFKLKPIGMYPLPGKVTFIHWKRSEEQTILISCDSGHIVEVKVPASRPVYTKNSFLLKLESRTIKTASIKSGSSRDDSVEETEKKQNEHISKMREKLETHGGENVGVESDKDLYFHDSKDANGEIPKLSVPAVSNAVLFAIYSPSEKSLWVSIDGHGAGYLYEYDFNSSGPINSIKLRDQKNTVPLTAINMLGSADESITIIMGFADGRIRVVNVNVADVSDFSDFIEYSIHDNITGRIKTTCFSQDNRMLYTCGDDRNIFSFMYQCDYDVVEKCVISISELPRPSKIIDQDINQTKENLKLSLEEIKINKERHKKLHLANKEKERIVCLLNRLKEKFKKVLDSNKALPKRLQFPQDYFQFHDQIDNSLITEAQTEMDKLQAELEFDYEKSLLGLTKVKNYFVDPVITAKFEVRAVLQDVRVKTIYHKNRHNLFRNLIDEFTAKKHKKQGIQKSNTIRPHNLTVLVKTNDNQNRPVSESEIFLRNMVEMYQFLPKKIQSAIDKFRARITYENEKIFNIESFEKENKKIDSNLEEIEIDNAWKTIGDFNLKNSPDFKLTEEQLVSMEDKYKQYMSVKNEINSLKSNFNEKIADLRQRKIHLLHDYKQFKFDVCRIQNELNDPGITSPQNFPEVLVDEFIDPSSIDSFEPLYHSDPLDFVLNPQINNLYPMSKNVSYECLTYLEIMTQQMLKDKLKHRHRCLHESMLTKITMFDNHLLMLKKLRKDVKLQITVLKLFSLTLEEELIILNECDLREDEYAYTVHLKTEQKNAKVDQIMKIQEDITHHNQFIKKKLNEIVDIQHTFEIEIRNNNFAKHLRKIFKKKFKTPKVKTYDDDDSLSSSSSDDSGDSESESENVKSDESLTTMGELGVYHENVLPEGCDPAIYALTFELRSKRYEMEKYIDSKRKIVESLNKSLLLAYAELETLENELKQNFANLETYRIKKQLKLNDVDMTIVLNKSQMTKTRLFKNSILVHGNVIQDLANRVTELKKETEEIQKTYKKEQLKAKQLRTEIANTNLDLKNYKLAIKDEIMKKFKTIASWSFIDEMERTIINYMIICANSNAEEMTERHTKEIKLINKKIRDHQEILADLLGAQTVKKMTLKGVRECNRQIQQSLIVQQQNATKIQHLSAVDDSNASNLTNLKNVCNTLSKRKEDLCKEIESLKHKGKMFPPIIQNQNMSNANRTAAKQANAVQDRPQSIGDQLHLMRNASPTAPDESEGSWTIKDDDDDGEEFYNMEFNVEPKAQSASSKQSSRLTKQSSHFDDDSSVGDDVGGENDWTRYCYDDRAIITPNVAVGDFPKIVEHDGASRDGRSDENVDDDQSMDDKID
ncbi:WD40/YVTN repeat-like-containing domain,WD40 repeat,WD40-repeat-containing domain [Cinara cedri]|uniref:WD40/YVTN repeat-like-containing domain,WD40 repeat,WD40-repeat-containing domain n=1 Tax=Cinara cedri TaxID=506608 RepID=A0A5E4MMU9_9HEMI|nr:WD40/YVTN repeat-like-containing domain,WD40 repeat,WD40-repeat-containing domain [Cinara cedri]